MYKVYIYVYVKDVYISFKCIYLCKYILYMYISTVKIILNITEGYYWNNFPVLGKTLSNITFCNAGNVL